MLPCERHGEVLAGVRRGEEIRGCARPTGLLMLGEMGAGCGLVVAACREETGVLGLGRCHGGLDMVLGHGSGERGVVANGSLESKGLAAELCARVMQGCGHLGSW